MSYRIVLKFVERRTPHFRFFLSVRQTSRMASDGAVLDRAKGCFYGQAVGDALGTRYEFEPATNVQRYVAAGKDAQGFLPIMGGGVFNVDCGQVTDDTEMAMAIARSLLRQGRYDDADVACSFFRWYCTEPFDIGITTKKALNLSCAPLKDDKWFEKVSAEQKEEILNPNRGEREVRVHVESE